VVKSSGRVYFVPTADIDWCEAAGNYVCLHVGAQSHLVRETMAHLESHLDPQQFVRIHRSTIVNVDRIQELRSSFNGEHVVLLRGGTRLTLSRGYREALQARLGTS
jgi:two-component system LytT family response regulator